MHKKVRNIYLRRGDHQFVLQSIFIYKAKEQKWNKEEINHVIQKTLYRDKITVYKILMQYTEKKQGIENTNSNIIY